jgi:predicted enzyme involved in methoxymalonyl-ACP biosynthesis
VKKLLQTLEEMELAACLIAAAGVALVLMLGHVLWKGVVGEVPQGSRTRAHSFALESHR